MSVLANKIVYPFITVLRMLIIDILLNLYKGFKRS